MANENEPNPGDEIRSFIERWESLESQKKDIAADQKEVMSEAKGRGYNTKMLRRLIAERKRDRDDLAEEEAILDLYRQAMGMSLEGHEPRTHAPDADDEEFDGV